MQLVTLCCHPQGRQADVQYITAALTGNNGTKQLSEAIRSAYGLANEASIFLRVPKPGGGYIFAATTYENAVEWLNRTIGQQPPGDDTRYVKGCPALWVKLPAAGGAPPSGGQPPQQPAAAAGAAESAGSARSNAATSSDPSTALAAGRPARKGKGAAAPGRADVWEIGPAQGEG